MLSQFTAEGGHPGLLSLGFDLPKDIYPVGRLDHDSEGLLILTNDNLLKTRLLDPKREHGKKYWVQVEGEATEASMARLRSGVQISINGKSIQTRPAVAEIIETPPVWERNPPIRVRKSIPDSWIIMGIHEGKNRQIRRMTASVGLPTLRLVRYSIENLTLGTLQPGEILELSKNDIYQKTLYSNR